MSIIEIQAALISLSPLIFFGVWLNHLRMKSNARKAQLQRAEVIRHHMRVRYLERTLLDND